MKTGLVNKSAKFGTMPVFLTALSTILGAVLFLRFGWAVGQIGFYGTIGIIVLGHLITIPAALAVAEIATNQKVQGGGAYYIVSRSFGFNIGGAIGIALFLSQAISVAFYIIAFAEAFGPVLNFLQNQWGIVIADKRFISLPLMAILSFLMLTRGANLGMKALYVVVGILFLSLLSFFLGSSVEEGTQYALSSTAKNSDGFFYVFTIIFPAFTGLAAGLGLSGDLKRPEKSIPRGTIWATIVGMLVYIFAAYKLATCAPASALDSDQLIMQRIAVWGPIIPIGLAAASLSSALGSVIVAPRTLQAIGFDGIFPGKTFNKWLARGKQKDNEPVNASIISIVIGFVFVGIGELNFVAEIISMIFIFTYGAICMISFMEHFSADPSYRPTFRSRWYISLVGALLSFWVMFKMNTLYAAFSLLLMVFIYYVITVSREEKSTGIGKLFKGVIFQLSRSLQLIAQRAGSQQKEAEWRPFAICISENTFKRRSAFDLMRWISYKYGFGTYIHYIPGMLNKETSETSYKVLDRLLNLAKGSKSRVYLDTIISPSYTSAIAQSIQLSSISGRNNNLILFEFSRSEPESMDVVLDNLSLIESARFDVGILNTSYKGFGYHKEIHLWLSSHDFENATTMILLAYIILGHPDWRKGIIRIFTVYPASAGDKERQQLLEMIKSGRLPISPQNVQLINSENEDHRADTIARYSSDADLCIIGLSRSEFTKENIRKFNGYDNLGNILYLFSRDQKLIQ
ncbi:MAG TPA: amino acid permease [Bacteroidales bacterium]|nr:amino acid permease [Bacteroidales bacterium]